jgi:hypothetical protein
MLTYQGYTSKGMVIPLGTPPLSDGLRVIITVLDEKTENETPARRKDITLASEKTLAHDWLLPEEDEAWACL